MPIPKYKRKHQADNRLEAMTAAAGECDRLRESLRDAADYIENHYDTEDDHFGIEARNAFDVAEMYRGIAKGEDEATAKTRIREKREAWNEEKRRMFR